MAVYLRMIALVLAAAVLAGCGVHPEKRAPASEMEISALAAEIRAMGPDVDPEEARRAARISYAYSRELAIRYQIVDPPLIHNTKVNMGLKPRGLCWHWAEDMEARLKAGALASSLPSGCTQATSVPQFLCLPVGLPWNRMTTQHTIRPTTKATGMGTPKPAGIYPTTTARPAAISA